MENDHLDYERFLAGDEEGLSALVERYRFSLFYFIQAILHDAVLSEEVMEDSFAALFLHRGKFYFRSSFKTYLFRIAKNKALDVLRHKKHLSFDALPENLTSFNDPLALCLKKEKSSELFSALSALHPPYRMVLYLLYIEEMSYEQAGAILHKSQKQIKNLAFRAREAAKKQLKEEL